MRRRARRWAAVAVALAVVSLAVVTVLDAPAPSRPNVVLIIVDTLRADALGSYDPAAAGLSPEIDALAARGVRLAQVTASSSWTRPSIGSLLTGQTPRTLGLYRETFDVLPESATTLAEALRASGYETVGVTANPNINSVFGFEQGFDRYVDSRVVWPWMTPEPGQRQRNRATTLPDARTILGDMLEHARAHTAGPDRKPTYMQITLMDVHEGWRLVRPEFRQDDRGRVGVPKGYWDAVRQVSHDIGAFVDALATVPGWGHTLFVITSDHGQGLDDHPDVERSWGHGRLLYGSQVDVPVIFYHPSSSGSGPWSWLVSRFTGRGQRLEPRTVERPVRLLDLAPTILERVGVATPPGTAGRSLARLVTDGDDPGLELPGYFVSETHYQGVDKIAVHTPAWTYIENRDHHEGLNPRELQPRGIRENGRLTDRIDDEPDVAADLAALLAGWESRHPELPATQPSEAVSPEELEQLRALGYME